MGITIGKGKEVICSVPVNLIPWTSIGNPFERYEITIYGLRQVGGKNSIRDDLTWEKMQEISAKNGLSIGNWDLKGSVTMITPTTRLGTNQQGFDRMPTDFYNSFVTAFMLIQDLWSDLGKSPEARNYLLYTWRDEKKCDSKARYNESFKELMVGYIVKDKIGQIADFGGNREEYKRKAIELYQQRQLSLEQCIKGSGHSLKKLIDDNLKAKDAFPTGFQRNYRWGR